MTIEILPRAREDIVAGYQFYEQQEHGAGTYFRDSIVTAVEELRVTGGAHAKRHGYHRAIANPFPFAIYYAVSEELVQVHAVFDCRRDPAALRQRLRET